MSNFVDHTLYVTAARYSKKLLGHQPLNERGNNTHRSQILKGHFQTPSRRKQTLINQAFLAAMAKQTLVKKQKLKDIRKIAPKLLRKHLVVFQKYNNKETKYNPLHNWIFEEFNLRTIEHYLHKVVDKESTTFQSEDQAKLMLNYLQSAVCLDDIATTTDGNYFILTMPKATKITKKQVQENNDLRFECVEAMLKCAQLLHARKQYLCCLLYTSDAADE